MSEGWSRKHVVSGDHSHVQRRERVRPRRTEGCGGRGELGDSISLRRGGTTTTGRRERKISQNMHVGMRRRRGVHHTGGNQET